jgi:hypothetical protein
MRKMAINHSVGEDLSINQSQTYTQLLSQKLVHQRICFVEMTWFYICILLFLSQKKEMHK